MFVPRLTASPKIARPPGPLSSAFEVFVPVGEVPGKLTNGPAKRLFDAVGPDLQALGYFRRPQVVKIGEGDDLQLPRLQLGECLNEQLAADDF
jgi:hypothetical protein